MPVTDSDRQERATRHAQRLRVRRLILAVLAIALSTWLAASALAPSTGPVARVLLIVIAVMISLHVLFWQLGFTLLEKVQKLPRLIGLPILWLALATSPLALYPLGAIAILFALFAGGGAATPALAVSGLVLLSPVIILVLIALAFALSGYKGG